MAVFNITQLHRISISRLNDKEGDTWDVVNFEPDDLGQDAQSTINIAPRKSSRSSSKGTTERPIQGTFDALAGTITILADYYHAIGRALGVWNKATYENASPVAGNMSDENADLCNDGIPAMVIVQGVCDDGSTADIELTRCYPSLDDDLEIGAGDTQEVTIALNPQIYNPTTMAEDGYPQRTYRLGDASLAEKQRYNAATGKYAKVEE